MFAQGDNKPGVLPCVWMSAGLVAFKLCDREGECEGCPFDRAMQGARRPEPPVSSLDIPSFHAGLKGGHLPARAGRQPSRQP
jgi:hypothetical protein